MVQRYGKGLWMLAVAVVLTVTLCTVVSASDGTTYYVKFGVPFVDVEGDFNGSVDNSGSFVSNPNVSVFVPRMDSGNGLGFVFGGVSGHWAGEFYYFTTNHNAYFTVLGTEYLMGDAIYREFGMNIKYYFADYQSSVINGYALVGIGYSRITVENAALRYDEGSDSFTDSGNALFKGATYNLGLGFTCRFSDHFAFEAQYLTSFTNITRVYGLGEKGKPTYDLVPVEEKIDLGIVYCF